MENVSWTTMYLIAMLPNIGDFLKFFLYLWIAMNFTVLFVLFISMPISDITGRKVIDPLKKFFFGKAFVTTYLILMLLGNSSHLIPDYKQLAFIVGGTWAVNNESVRQMPDNIAMIVNGYLEQMTIEKDEVEE